MAASAFKPAGFTAWMRGSSPRMTDQRERAKACDRPPPLRVTPGLDPGVQGAAHADGAADGEGLRRYIFAHVDVPAVDFMKVKTSKD